MAALNLHLKKRFVQIIHSKLGPQFYFFRFDSNCYRAGPHALAFKEKQRKSRFDIISHSLHTIRLRFQIQLIRIANRICHRWQLHIHSPSSHHHHNHIQAIALFTLVIRCRHQVFVAREMSSTDDTIDCCQPFKF